MEDKSTEFFNRIDTQLLLADLEGVINYVVYAKNEAEAVRRLLAKYVLPDKLYMLTAGMHAAVIRRTGNRFEYMELQHSLHNGWTPLTAQAIGKQGRFGCFAIAEDEECRELLNPVILVECE